MCGLYVCSDEEFARWAFGQDTWDKFMVYERDVIDLMHAWNDLHGDELLIKEDDSLSKSIRNMKKIWEGINE